MRPVKENTKEKKHRLKPKYIIFLLLLIVVFILSFVAYRVAGVKKPVVSGMEALKTLSLSKTAHIEVDSNLTVKSVEIRINQKDNSFVLLSDSPDQAHKEYDLKVEPKKMGLVDGSGKITIKASAGLFSSIEFSFNTTIDLVPPTISVIESSYLAHQGSAASALVYSNGADRVYIKIEEREFRASNKVRDDKNLYFAIFPIERELPLNSIIYAIAEDKAGNKVLSTVSTKIKKATFKSDKINISDNFINRKIYPLIGGEGETLSPIKAFLLVNEKWRKKNELEILTFTKVFTDELLWNGKFIQMKNSKVFSRFGDSRDYIYKGEVVSHSKHLGYDLASIKNVAVGAANSGKIVMTSPMGIYGNSVIIDHGLGLMSMYAHLSSVNVEDGDMVEKGEFIGHTGATGLAGGDHLHYAVTVHGVYVSPLPWWDKKWIEKRITNILHADYQP